MTREPTAGHSQEYCEGWHDGFEAQDVEIIEKLRAEVERLRLLLRRHQVAAWCEADSDLAVETRAAIGDPKP